MGTDGTSRDGPRDGEPRPPRFRGPTEQQLENPNFGTILQIVWFSLYRATRERPGQIILSTYFLIMLWGSHGNLELLKRIVPGWEGAGSDPDRRPRLIPGIPWDQELISFLGGFFLLVLVPIVLIKKVFRQSLDEYGLGLPPRRRWKLALTTWLSLVGISLPPFLIAANDPDMRRLYPFYRKLDPNNPRQFALYELSYLPFFVAIEFVFRGYLLFGLQGLRSAVTRHGGGAPRNRFFTRYALLIQMLSYTAWHLGKPLPELWGAFVWGIAAGATAFASRSIWPVVLAHWLLNVYLDGKILGLRLFPSRTKEGVGGGARPSSNPFLSPQETAAWRGSAPGRRD